jgi:hypothetical protein
VLVASAFVTSALFRDGCARVGGRVGRWVGDGNTVCSRFVVVVVVVSDCRRGCACKLACMFVRTLPAASDVWVGKWQCSV